MGLEKFFSSDGFLTNHGKDNVFDGICGRIVLRENCFHVEKLIALNMLARLSYECVAMPLNVIYYGSPSAGDLIIISSEDIQDGMARLSLLNGVYQLEFSATNPSGVDYFIMRMPYTGKIGKGYPVLEDLRRNLCDDSEIMEVIARKEQVVEIGVHCGSRKCTFTVDPAMTGYMANKMVLPDATIAMSTESMKPDLCDLFSVRGFYTDPENGLINDRTAYNIVIDDSLSALAIIAVGNIVSRLCVECLSLRSGIIRSISQEDNKPVLRIVENSSKTARLYQVENDIELAGNPEALLAFSQLLAREYPYLDENRFLSLRDMVTRLEEVLSGRSAAGQLAEFMSNNAKRTPVIYLSDTSEINTSALVDRAIIKCERHGNVIWEDNRILPSELEDFRKKIIDICNGLSTGDKVDIFALLDKDKRTREALSGELAAAVKRCGAELSNCELLCAYKQGLYWLSESVAPRLRGLDVELITIFYSPFFHKKIAKWSEYEDDILPFDISDPDWVDLPIRFFNELYPVDDILSNAVGIHRDRITFKAAKLSSSYRIECRNNSGGIVFTEDFSVTMRERLYLEEFPELGTVWVNTGRLRVMVNGNVRMDETIFTDIEQVWAYGQNYLFHEAGVLLAAMQKKGELPVPVFREIILECSLCAVDDKLPFRTDTISSLETLHEDIHFVGLEFFKHVGKKIFGQEILAPGLILPIVRKKNEGPPEVKARILAKAADEPCMQLNGKVHIPTIIDCELRVCELAWSDNVPELRLETDDKQATERLKCYASLLMEGVIQDDISRSGWLLTVTTPSGDIAIRTRKPEPMPKTVLDLERLDTNEPITYSRYLSALESLRGIKELNTFVIAKSYQGRSIYAVELMDIPPNSIVSRCKLVNSKPSYLLNNRHHANEVSSTGMIFELIKNLLLDPDWQGYRQGIHISMIPFANVDGGALHETLLQDNPEWMLHAARFNAVGVETRSLYFDDTTPYTEATALPKLWELCLPDIIVDNHGIPNHECNFPAFGRNRIELRSNWLPCAQFFGFLTYIDDPRYTVNHNINDRVREFVASAINADTKISAQNSEWRNRYEKYAHSVMPKFFKAEYYKGIIFHSKWQKLHSDWRNISLRYPDITIMDWITEVADETATGDNLKTCVKTHLIACRATMDAILSFNVHPENRDREYKNGILLWRKRNRPIKI